jgi:hypothetical protein
MLNTVVRNSTRILLKRSRHNIDLKQKRPSFNRNRILIKEKTLKSIFESSNKPKPEEVLKPVAWLGAGVFIGSLYFFVVEPIIDTTIEIVRYYRG